MFSSAFLLCTRSYGKLVAGLFSCLFILCTATSTKDLNIWESLLDKLNPIQVQTAVFFLWNSTLSYEMRHHINICHTRCFLYVSSVCNKHFLVVEILLKGAL